MNTVKLVYILVFFFLLVSAVTVFVVLPQWEENDTLRQRVSMLEHEVKEYQRTTPTFCEENTQQETPSALNLNELQYDVALVTQTTPERANRVKWLIDRWEGPISAAIAVSHGEGHSHASVTDIKNHISNANRRNVIITVYETRQDKIAYPMNFMRNLAISQAPTEFILYVDVDFIPSITAYKNIINSQEELRKAKEEKTVLVLPAFDLFYFSPENVNNKQDLLEEIKRSKAEQFHKHFAESHRKVDYAWWKEAEEPYDIEYEDRFEPYFVGHRSMPLYDERLMGYGYNKVSQVYELWTRSYQFRVLPHDFVMHVKHSYSRKLRSSTQRDKNKNLFEQMQQELYQETGRKWPVFGKPIFNDKKE
eukprot:gb/GECH01012000.1/.p1 GENE.gb/GECH01012000.1/~~gb/GECH01012000.1/.p1  ORF type:complete len:364 (+),score=56.91 gb/GECH01012000.1/:1-1092(+)